MDLQLTDRVFIVTGGARGLGRATADVLVAEGARVVLSGRSQESLDEATGGARRGRRAPGGGRRRGRQRRPRDPGTAARRRRRGVRPRRRRPDQRRRPAEGSGHRRSPTTSGAPPSSRSSSAPSASHARSAPRCPTGGSLGLVLSSSVRAPLPEMAISNGLRPGLAMVAKTLADELGPRGVRVNGLLPGRIATERVAELDASTGDPEAARRGRGGDDPAGALRRAARSSARSPRSCCRRPRHS